MKGCLPWTLKGNYIVGYRVGQKKKNLYKTITSRQLVPLRHFRSLLISFMLNFQGPHCHLPLVQLILNLLVLETILRPQFSISHFLNCFFQTIQFLLGLVVPGDILVMIFTSCWVPSTELPGSAESGKYPSRIRSSIGNSKRRTQWNQEAVRRLYILTVCLPNKKNLISLSSLL